MDGWSCCADTGVWIRRVTIVLRCMPMFRLQMNKTCAEPCVSEKTYTINVRFNGVSKCDEIDQNRHTLPLRF